MQKKWMDIWNEAIANNELEANVPIWLYEDLKNYCIAMDEGKDVDIWWCEVYGSINSSGLSQEEADYLRDKYLFE